jgi:hypothetical protein
VKNKFLQVIAMMIEIPSSLGAKIIFSLAISPILVNWGRQWGSVSREVALIMEISR